MGLLSREKPLACSGNSNERPAVPAVPRETPGDGVGAGRPPLLAAAALALLAARPDNVTVGPGERWPDIVVAQTGFQGAAEVYWNRSLSYRSSHNPDHSVRAAACVPLWRRGVSCSASCSALERVCRRRR